MAKRLSPAALSGLEEALTHLYWYKEDLKKFLFHCLGNDAGLVAVSDWTDNKRNVVGRLLRTMGSDQDRYLEDLRRLCIAVVAFEDFPHLSRLEDGERKAAKAKAAVAQLRKLTIGHLGADKEREEIERRREADAARSELASSMHRRLNEVRADFMKAVGAREQDRGYRLEKILYELFSLFDMDPKASFKIVGEQIDGAFSFETADYILETKWTSSPSTREDIDVFASKVDRKLDNTLGLFISISGFASTALSCGGTGRAKVIAMTGEDLMAVLDERISLPELLRRKRRHGAHTGEMLLTVADMLNQG